MPLTNEEMVVDLQSRDIEERKERAEYPRLDDPNDCSPLNINLPALPSDNRQYRFLRLENGLKILLIHHPITVESEVILRVNAGSFDEPDEFPGLAHFLEHMLFMGSEKYPDEDEYQKYITQNSGEFNAHTKDRHTQFSFSIGTKHLEPTVDRLSQFFISPLLKRECVEREIQAVDQEFEGKKEIDLKRLKFVMQRFKNPKHPASRFSAGNRETLKDIESVLPLLKKFYNEYYKANNMTLVLESNYSLDEQEIIAKRYFSTILRGAPTIKKYREVLSLLPDAFQVKCTTESIQHNNIFIVDFVFSLKRTLENEAALEYINSLFSNSSPGGLSDHLKREEMITSFGVSHIMTHDPKQNLVVVMVFDLTKVGVRRTDEILKSIFNYVNFLKKTGVEEKIFKELQDIKELHLKFKASEFMGAAGFLDTLEDYPLERFFLGDRITRATPFPEQAIKTILDLFSPEIMRQFIIQDEKMLGAYEVEPYTGAKFKRERASFIESWFELREDSIPFSLPRLSPYIPQDFSIKPLLSQLKRPTLIHDEERLRVWLSHDHDFKLPSVQTDCYLISRLVRDTPLAVVCSNMLFLMYNLEISKEVSRGLNSANAFAYPVHVQKGLHLRISSYSDKHDKIITDLFNLLMHFEFIDSHFEIQKQTFRDNLLKSKKAPVCGQGLEHLSTLFDNFQYSTEAILEALDNFDIKTLEEYRQNLLSGMKLEVVCHGNMNPQESIALGASIMQQLNLKGAFVSQPQAKIIKMAAGDNLHYSFKSKVKGNAMVLFLQIEDDDVQTKYLCKLLSNILQPKYFDQLRTQQQLAYTIDCFPSFDNGGGLVFVIESSEYLADYLLEKTKEFLDQMKDYLQTMPENVFVASNEALNNILAGLNHLESPDDYRLLFSQRFQRHRYQFNRIFDSLTVSSQITVADLQKLYSSMLDPSTCRRIVVKSQDEAWTEADLLVELIRALKVENDEENNKKETALKKIVPIIFSYTQPTHNPYRLIEDISTFKKEATSFFPDEMKEGEEYIQSLLEFNQGLLPENFANGELLDEDRVKDALELTPLSTSTTVVDTTLAYCFRHYKMREGTQPKTDNKPAAVDKVTFHLPA